MGTAVAGSGIGQGPRNPGAFIFLLPGVSEGNRWGTINGAQGFSKDVFIEGVPITDPIQQGEGRTISLGVSVEAVEQFQVETSGTGVEFNGQGSENYTIKSGTNQFHGSGFEYSAKYRAERQGILPGSSSGRASKRIRVHHRRPDPEEKLFFFFSYDGWRYRVTSPTQFATVPTLKMRQGDFSELPVAIYDPLTTVAVAWRLRANGVPGEHHSGRTAFQRSRKSISRSLPAPTNSGLQNNYLGSVPVAYNNNNFNTKVDYNLTANHRLSGIYTHGKRSQPGAYRETSSAIPQTVLPLPYTDTRLVTEIPTVVQAKHNWTIRLQSDQPGELRLQPLLRSHHQRHFGREVVEQVGPQRLTRRAMRATLSWKPLSAGPTRHQAGAAQIPETSRITITTTPFRKACYG